MAPVGTPMPPPLSLRPSKRFVSVKVTADEFTAITQAAEGEAMRLTDYLRFCINEHWCRIGREDCLLLQTNQRRRSIPDMVRIAELHASGLSVRAIAAQLGYASSTVQLWLTEYRRPHEGPAEKWVRRLRGVAADGGH